MKKICLSGIGLCSIDIAKAVGDLPRVMDLGNSKKSEAKQRKKLLREFARRQKRLDKLALK